jgi:hypothetical protein
MPSEADATDPFDQPFPLSPRVFRADAGWNSAQPAQTQALPPESAQISDAI